MLTERAHNKLNLQILNFIRQEFLKISLKKSENIRDYLNIFTFQSKRTENFIKKLENDSDFKQLANIDEFKAYLAGFYAGFGRTEINNSEYSRLVIEIFNHVPLIILQDFLIEIIKDGKFGILLTILPIIKHIDVKSIIKTQFKDNPNQNEDEKEEFLRSMRIYINKEIFQRIILVSKPSIFIESIKIPQNPWFPSGELTNLTNYNVIIGKNNQKKTRLLHLIDFIIKSLARYPSILTVERTEDQLFLDCLNMGVLVDIKIQRKTFDNESLCWGWDIPGIITDEHEIQVEFKKNRMRSSNSSVAYILGTTQQLKLLFIPEYFKLKQNERMPETGFATLFKQYKDNDKSFLEIFRRLLYYHHNIHEFVPDIMQFRIFEDSIQMLINHFFPIWKKIELDLIFHDKRFPNFDIEEFLNPSILQAYQIMKKHNLFSSIRLDKNENQFLMEIDSQKKGKEIALQGHGIRKTLILLAAWIFNDVFLLDEPENGLHIDLQSDIRNFLQQNSIIQTFVSTHSPTMINFSEKLALFTIDNNQIIYRPIYPDLSQISRIKKNLTHIKSLIGLSPESLLFSKCLLFVEGKNDRKEFFEILKELNIKPIPINGKSKVFSLMRNFEEIQNDFPLPIYYLFDRDYFNDYIYSSKKSKLFFLPCYSTENLLIDPYFIASILPIEIEDLLLTYKEIFAPKKKETLEKLLLHFIFKNNIPKIVRDRISSISLDWSKECIQNLLNLCQNTVRDITRRNIESICELSMKTTSLKPILLNHLLLIQVLGKIPTQEQIDLLSGFHLDWGNIKSEELAEKFLESISVEKIMEGIKKVSKIDENWDYVGFSYIEIKSWLGEFLNELNNILQLETENYLNKKFLSSKYKLFLQNRPISQSISYKLLDIFRQMN